MFLYNDAEVILNLKFVQYIKKINNVDILFEFEDFQHVITFEDEHLRNVEFIRLMSSMRSGKNLHAVINKTLEDSK